MGTFNIGAASDAGNTILLAAGASDEWGEVHGAQASARIDWWKGYDPSASGGGGSQPLTKTAFLVLMHAIAMIFAWTFFVPSGILVSRFRANYHAGKGGAWFRAHRVIQSIGWLLTVAGFASAYAA